MPQKKRSSMPEGKRQRTATAAVRRKTMLVQSGEPRRVESRIAPSRKAERRHARPGAGIKRARGVMTKRSR